MAEESTALQMGNVDSVLNQYQYLEKCLPNFAKSLRDCNCRRIGKAFPEIYRENLEVLQLISDGFGEKYEGALKESYDRLIKEYDLKGKMSKLPELPHVQDEGWRPAGKKSYIRLYIYIYNRPISQPAGFICHLSCLVFSSTCCFNNFFSLPPASNHVLVCVTD